MLRLRFLAPALLALVALAPPAHAQGNAPAPRWWHVGVGGGVSVPVSDAKDAWDNGVNGLAYFRVTPSGFGITFGVNVTFSTLDFSDSFVTTSAPGVTSGTTEMLGGLGDMKVNVMHLGPVTPYITGGVGVYNLKTETDGVTSSNSDTAFGINGGAGLSIAIRSISIYVQGRVDNVYTSESRVIDKDAIQVVPVSAGIEF